MPVAKLPYTYITKGKYWRFRRGGIDAPIKGAPGEAVFHARYAELMGLSGEKPVADDGSMAALIAAYRKSAEFRLLRGPTQLDYERTLDLIVDQLGDQPYRLITSKMVKVIRDDLAATPRKAHKFKQMTSRLYTWGAEDGLIAVGINPAAGFKRLKVRQETITPWSDSEIALFLAHAPAHLRLAVKLLLYTGQRCEDIAMMEWGAYQGGYIRVRQSKTGEAMEIAAHAELRAVLDPVMIRKGRIVRNAKGRPYTANALRKAIADSCADIDGMPASRSPHGLRYAAAGSLEEAGATVGQIVAVLGHRTYQMAIKYLTARRESAAGIAKMAGLA